MSILDALSMTVPDFPDPSAVATALEREGYLPDAGLAAAVFLALRLRRPLFLEGEPGVGKTALAQAMADVLKAPLVRLQCYGGIDASQALYDWNFPKQILALRSAAAVESVYSREFLVMRPILQAIETSPCVLLVDEIDRADDEFEAFLLEVLESGSVSIPEIGTITAAARPLVVLTSNRTREVHDALKRRCIYHWIDHPDIERETTIVRRRSNIPQQLAEDVAQAMHRLRSADLTKPPGVSEAIDLAGGVMALGGDSLTPRIADLALGTVVKHQDDLARARTAILPEPARTVGREPLPR